MRIAFVFALFVATASHAEPVLVSKHLQEIMARGDGLTPATAFKVASVEEEYEIARALGLKIGSQALIFQKKKPFDMFAATNEAGETREVWFDISRFYGKFAW